MYIAISFSHQNADMALREKLYFSNEESLEILPKICSIPQVSEAIILSTCNRCEIYAYIDINNDYYIIAKQILQCLAEHKHINSEILNIANIMVNLDAIHHVFCVASSLLSVVIGETQISGQLKVAYKLSYDNHFCARFLTRLVHFAFRCAASVRANTDISKNPISIASVASSLAIDFIQRHGLSNARILIIGVGEMGTLALKHLSKHHVKLTLCNRTRHKAKALIESLGLECEVLDFSVLKDRINDYDIVLSAVANGVIIESSMICAKEQVRMFLDLSMPRNFGFNKEDLPKEILSTDIEMVGIDDLKILAKEHIAKREESARSAMGIVGRFTHDFSHWIASLGVEPLIKTMRLKAKEASLKEIDRAIKKGFIKEDMRDNVMKLVHSAFNEFLHEPTMRLKDMSEDENADSIIEAISSVFGMQDRILLNRYKCEYDNVRNG